MIRTLRALLGLGAALTMGCGDATAVTYGPTEARVIFCMDVTRGVELHTELGGTLRVEAVDACGATVNACVAPDRFARGARASVRIAGTTVYVDGCSFEAATAERLVFRFLAEGEEETWELPAVGACLLVPPGCDDGA